MLHVSKPVDWDVFSTPPSDTVQYYSILKNKREFSQLIKEYDSQVFRHGYLHYCCIVPKSTFFELNHRNELFILFFDEIRDTSFIGFRVKVSEDTFLLEANLLLLFLKNSNKAVCYLMKNNCIHVKCKRSVAWELFYRLYDEYLRRYLLTVIGTQFFYSFFYSYFIEKEKLLLEMLFSGSKIVNISKKSVFYKIHKKRKLSVTDLLYITYNMPKSKKYAMSYFRFKKAHMVKGDKSHPVTIGKNYTVSNKQQKMFKQQSTTHHASSSSELSQEILGASNSFYHTHSESVVPKDESNKSNQFQIPQKRKFQEIETDDHKVVSSASTKFFKSEDSDVEVIYRDHWKKYCDFKPLIIKSYSEIAQVKQIFPLLIKNGSKLEDFSLSQTTTDALQYETPIRKEDVKKTTLILKNTYEEKCFMQKAYNSDVTARPNRTEFFLKKCEPSLDSPSLNNQVHQKDIIADPVNKKISNDISQVITLGNLRDNSIHTPDDATFSTASGKAIFVSHTAMLAAQKIVENVLFSEEVPTPQEPIKVNVSQSKTCDKRHSLKDIDTKFKNVTEKIKHAEQPQMSNKTFYDGNPSKEFVTFSKNLNNRYFEDVDNESFTTAAGKNINISNAAMLAAQKMLQEVVNEDQEFEVAAELDAFKNVNYQDPSTFKNISCSSKKFKTDETTDVDMDGTLVEKFFEDTHFDEKDFEPHELAAAKNLNSDSELNKNNSLPIHKPRKSLGGRRSIRYSDKL